MQTVPSWPRPDVPALPPGPPVSLYDSASGALRRVHPDSGEALLYVCGITPYDATHLGHAATYLAFDTLARAWRSAGLRVRTAQNITDVDDPLLERARSTGRDWRQIALEQSELFRSDMTALRIVPPDAYVRVQDVLEETGEAVRRMLDEGTAYLVPVPADARPAARSPEAHDVYFDIAAAERSGVWRLGSAARTPAAEREALFREFGGDPDRPGKRGPLDPLLWRAAREGEPAWPSPAGEGRPGWHVECAVIATGALGPTVTVQAGGRDLRFPHHDLSAGHAAALTGEPFADVFAHAGLVAYRGEKMSKSLGNLVLVSRLREAGADPAAIRLAVLSHHYREDWEWREEELRAAESRLERWRAAAVGAPQAGPGEGKEPSPTVLALQTALADDLDTPAAIAAVDEWAARAGGTPGAGDVPRAVDALLGIDPSAS